MNEPIQVSYQCTVDQMVMAQEYHWRYGLLFPRNLLTSLPGIAAFVLGMGLFLYYGTHVGLIYLTVLALGMIGFRRRRRQKLRHQLAAADKEQAMQWAIADEQLTLAIPDQPNATFIWSQVTQVMQTSEGVLIYPTPETFHWLPKESFTSDSDWQQFTALAKSKVKRFRDMT